MGKNDFFRIGSKWPGIEPSSYVAYRLTFAVTWRLRSGVRIAVDSINQRERHVPCRATLLRYSPAQWIHQLWFHCRLWLWLTMPPRHRVGADRRTSRTAQLIQSEMLLAGSKTEPSACKQKMLFLCTVWSLRKFVITRQTLGGIGPWSSTSYVYPRTLWNWSFRIHDGWKHKTQN